MKPIKFALFGVAGYIARKHIEVIKQIGGELVAAIDPVDNVGYLDRYFPDCKYYKDEAEYAFDKSGIMKEVDYTVICVPNNMHFTYCSLGLSLNSNVICEKPLVTDIKHIQRLMEIEQETGKKVYPILQLRYHHELKKFKKFYDNSACKVKIVYHTPRGDWYHKSWKGNKKISGGLGLNIGIHFFDLLVWLFGGCRDINIAEQTDYSIMGNLILKYADVDFDLSIDKNYTPERKIAIISDKYNNIIDLTAGMQNLHWEVYNDILFNGYNFNLKEMEEPIRIANSLCYNKNNKSELDKLLIAGKV